MRVQSRSSRGSSLLYRKARITPLMSRPFGVGPAGTPLAAIAFLLHPDVLGGEFGPGVSTGSGEGGCRLART